jgi:hypothetical protein
LGATQAALRRPPRVRSLGLFRLCCGVAPAHKETARRARLNQAMYTAGCGRRNLKGMKKKVRRILEHGGGSRDAGG